MLGKIITIVGLTVAGWSTVQAKTVDVEIKGALTSIEYDYTDGVITYGAGGAASTAFLDQAPIGTAYTLRYSYDSEINPSFSYPGGASYDNLMINPIFSLAGVDFAIQYSSYFAGNDGFGQRYSLYGNFLLSATSNTLGGFKGIDYSFDVSNPVNAGPFSNTFLDTVELDNFRTRRARLRFSDFATGETGVLFSIDSVASTGAVPEPATWAMMIAGFSVVGATMRRRRMARPLTA